MKIDKNFKIEVTRGSGPGGQHKNKVETCVTITHIPTGLKERCQDSRSQHGNIVLAMERLTKKIEDTKTKELNNSNNEKRLFLIKNPKTIRTYNYVRNEVVDHKSKKHYNLKKFMNGKIEHER